MSTGTSNTSLTHSKNLKRNLANRKDNHLHIKHQHHMERRLYARRDINSTNRKTIIRSNQQRSRHLRSRKMNVHNYIRKKKKTTIFNVYRPGNTAIELVGNSTVIEQQWIIQKHLKKKGHPHDVTINDLIQATKEKQNNSNEIILTIDGNETFSYSPGGIAKVCKACKLFDPMYQQHGEAIGGPSHINGSERIDFIFVTDKILPFIKACGSTAFNELTISDHKGFYIDILREGIMKRSESILTSPFSRSVQSNNPQAIRKCKSKLEIQIVKFNIEERLDKRYQIAKLNKLNNNDEKELNQIDDDITTSMLQAEKSIQTQHHNHPWSPTLHRAIRKVTTWKAILTQIKTGYSQQKQIQKLQKNVTSLITTTWTTMKDIKHNIQVAQEELRTIIPNAYKLRKQHLLKKASAHDIQNKKSSPKTIINILKIEAIIKMWTRINSMASLNTLDIPIDTTIHRNDIKKSHRLTI